MREIYVNKDEITEINGFLQRDIDGDKLLIFLRVTNEELFKKLIESEQTTLRIPDLILNRKKKDYNTNKMDMIYYTCDRMAYNDKDMSIVFMNSRRYFMKINNVRKNRINNLPE